MMNVTDLTINSKYLFPSFAFEFRSFVHRAVMLEPELSESLKKDILVELEHGH